METILESLIQSEIPYVGKLTINGKKAYSYELSLLEEQYNFKFAHAFIGKIALTPELKESFEYWPIQVNSRDFKTMFKMLNEMPGDIKLTCTPETVDIGAKVYKISIEDNKLWIEAAIWEPIYENLIGCTLMKEI